MPVKSEPVVDDGSMAGNNDNKKTPPWHDNKDASLRRLQKSVHFVKTMTRSNVDGSYTMAMPTWFVWKHGDKFEQKIFLQSRISPVAKPWRVQLSLCKPTHASSPEVKLGSGWRDFAVVHGLAVGDNLLFSLRAMSEFDVYVFRKPAPPRKRSRGFDEQVPLPKTGECSSGHSDEGLSEVSTTTKKPNIGEDNGPIFAFHGRSMPGTCASPFGLHYLDSRDLQGPSRLRSDVSQHRQESPIRERTSDENPKAVNEKAETKTTSPPSFRKRLIARNVCRGASSLEIPSCFWKSAYAEGLHPPVVKLQGIHERSPGRIVVCKWCKTGEKSRLYLTDGWREFGEENGQEVVFTLTADSFLVVRAA